METITFLEFAQRVLEEEKKALTADEIWEIGKGKGYDILLGTEGKTPWASLGARLYVQVRDHKEGIIAQTDTRPKRFYLRYQKMSPIDIENTFIDKLTPAVKIAEKTYLEKNLHPFLAYFAYYYLKSYCLTIQHTKSDKKEYGEWVHPDMVGCYFTIEEWKSEVVHFSNSISNAAIKIFSFELKRELTFSNLRESFFQAVSNSSWAHEGYLATASIANDSDFKDELKRLSSSFGIGIILLDIEDPDASVILFPARTRENLDWDTINKLTMNPDFKEFLKRVSKDQDGQEIRKEKYDKILDRDTLIKSLKQETK